MQHPAAAISLKVARNYTRSNVPQYRGICGSTRQQAPLSTYTPYFEDCYDGGKRVARQAARSPDIGLATGRLTYKSNLRRCDPPGETSTRATLFIRAYPFAGFRWSRRKIRVPGSLCSHSCDRWEELSSPPFSLRSRNSSPIRATIGQNSKYPMPWLNMSRERRILPALVKNRRNFQQLARRLSREREKASWEIRESVIQFSPGLFWSPRDFSKFRRVICGRMEVQGG